ncbi:SRPBCC family protein [Pseudaestuariivita sp.]|uniref:SRPBCC family protein n=1 Tax=Pseudaestuariivita sp. TaxID=2211669 RepID=UPI00405A0930
MKLKKIAAVTACATLGLAVASLALPRHVSIERSAVIDAAPERVIALAASNTGYQSFNPYWQLDPELKVDMFGPETGVGSGFHFASKDGAGSQTVAKVSASQVDFDLDLGPLGTPTQAIKAVATDAGTRVTWTMDADMGFNPVFRVMGLFMDGMVGPNFELGLENIALETTDDAAA